MSSRGGFRSPLVRKSKARERRLESTFFLINVIFLLLLFFVVAGKLNLDVTVSPPQAAPGGAGAEAALRVSIEADGTLRLNGEAMSLEALGAALAASAPIASLAIAADRDANAVAVARLLTAAAPHVAGRTTLVTVPRGGPGPATGD